MPANAPWTHKRLSNRCLRRYDAMVLGQEQEMALVLTRERAVTWVKRQEEAKEKEWTLAQKLIAKAEEVLASPKTRWSGRDAYMALEVASKLMRLSTGMATERRQEEVVGPDGGPVQVQVDISAALKKVYGSSPEGPLMDGPIIEVNDGRESRVGCLPERSEGDGLPGGSDGESAARGDCASAAAVGSERGSPGV